MPWAAGRFGDFAAHLEIPRAVLTGRLETLRAAGVLAETRGGHGTCATCGSAVPSSDLLIPPGPGYDGEGDDLVSKTLTTAHRLVEPIRGH